VCIIGATIRNEMLAGQPPLGATLRVGKISCEVIGVLEPKGQVMFGGDQDLLVTLPIRTYQRRVAGSDKVGQIFMSGDSPETLTDIKNQVAQVMRERRHIAAGARSDFNIMDMTEVSNVMQNTIGIMTTFLSAIAAVSLLVGGIGIMNIMLVSVTERTREIGIRLAIGATEQEVMLQFLVEAALLSALGGLAGDYARSGRRRRHRAGDQRAVRVSADDHRDGVHVLRGGRRRLGFMPPAAARLNRSSVKARVVRSIISPSPQPSPRWGEGAERSER